MPDQGYEIIFMFRSLSEQREQENSVTATGEDCLHELLGVLGRSLRKTRTLTSFFGPLLQFMFMASRDRNKLIPHLRLSQNFFH